MKFKLITLSIILCLGFTSCSENETPEPRTTRTILVYMMANNSLNSFASKNIESMIEGATSKNLNGGNLIVYYAPAGSPPELLRIKEENGVVKKIHLKDYEKLFKFYSKIILWQRYASWLRAYRPCIHSQWSVS